MSHDMVISAIAAVSNQSDVVVSNINKLPVRVYPYQDVNGRWHDRKGFCGTPAVLPTVAFEARPQSAVGPVPVAVQEQIVAQFNQANPVVPVVEGLPEWDVPSGMTFHIKYPKDLIPVIRRPDMSLVPKLRLGAHETRQILDDRMAGRGRYGIVTFEGGNKATRSEMKQIATDLSRGRSLDGVRYRCIYAHALDEGFMLFVEASSGIYCLKQLGIHFSNDVKGAKRGRRFFAAHSMMTKGQIVNPRPVTEGIAYDLVFSNGAKYRALDFNMNMLDNEQASLKEGSVICNIPGFDGTMATFGGLWGQGKGATVANSRVTAYDLVMYDTKKEVAFTDGTVYLGILSRTELHDFTIDLQTLTNTGLYENHLVVREGLLRMKEIAELTSGDDENAIIDAFTGTVKASLRALEPDQKPWPLVRAVTLDIGSKAMPVLERRLFNHLAEESIDMLRGRVKLPNGIRVHVFPNPLMDSATGVPILADDKITDTVDLDNVEHLPQVCIPDGPAGEMAIGRSPNTHSGEIQRVWNVFIPELMIYKGQGRAFFGRDGGEILALLNGGDFDDEIFCFWGKAYMAKFRTMQYPVELITSVKAGKAKSYQHKQNVQRYKTGSNIEWTPNIFFEQLKDYEKGGESLGAFIIRGWIDMLLSGEHRPWMAANLAKGNYTLPENFTVPSLDTLKKLVSADVLKAAGEYEATEAYMVKVAKLFVDMKADFVARKAMSNSSYIIDWTQMRKGEKWLVDELVANSMLALNTPIFPLCFKDRIPAKRREAGDYILVETKMCFGLGVLNARRNQMLEDNHQLEHMIKHQLPQAMLDAYPCDEALYDFETRQGVVGDVITWWREQFENARMDFPGVLPKEVFQEAAYGKIGQVEVRQADGTIKREETRSLGLIDLYMKDSEGTPWSLETRRKIAIWLANIRYTANTEPRVDDDGFTMSVNDGILLDEMLHDIFDVAEELGLTGRVEFMDLNGYARKIMDDGDVIRVNAIDGDVFHVSNCRMLSRTPSKTLPDGSYMMSSTGKIVVKKSCPEFQSDYLSTKVAALAANGFEFDEN
jgi:hypothetical protein